MGDNLSIPIAIVVAGLIQLVAAGYFAGTIRQILKDHERRIGVLEE